LRELRGRHGTPLRHDPEPNWLTPRLPSAPSGCTAPFVSVRPLERAWSDARLRWYTPDDDDDAVVDDDLASLGFNGGGGEQEEEQVNIWELAAAIPTTAADDDDDGDDGSQSPTTATRLGAFRCLLLRRGIAAMPTTVDWEHLYGSNRAGSPGSCMVQ
jgi:hypothetical protein